MGRHEACVYKQMTICCRIPFAESFNQCTWRFTLPPVRLGQPLFCCVYPTYNRNSKGRCLKTASLFLLPSCFCLLLSSQTKESGISPVNSVRPITHNSSSRMCCLENSLQCLFYTTSASSSSPSRLSLFCSRTYQELASSRTRPLSASEVVGTLHACCPCRRRSK
jgi:hypothetical protein